MINYTTKIYESLKPARIFVSERGFNAVDNAIDNVRGCFRSAQKRKELEQEIMLIISYRIGWTVTPFTPPLYWVTLVTLLR